MLWIRKIHKWASVIVGIQFLLWLSSGLFFNLMDHQKAKGNTFKSHVRQSDRIDINSVVEPRDILEKFNACVTLTTTTLLGVPYYLLNHEKGLYQRFKNRYTLVNAYSGNQVIIDQSMANELALASYNGPGKILKTTLLKPPIKDFPKRQNPSWQINFSDELNTSIYIEAESGFTVGHSDDHKRFADIFFMLHFMDYGSEGSFNNWQIILFAFITLWLSFTGIIWTIDLGLRGQYKLKFFAKNRQVKLFDKHQKSLGEITLSTHTNLLNCLVDNDIILPSSCGGGGTCGRCKVMVTPITKTTSADNLHFSEKELLQGYRLACQHFCHDVEHMTLMDVSEAVKLSLTLTKNRFISPDMKELHFKLPNDRELSFKAGAFLRFFIPEGTISSLPEDLPQEYQDSWKKIKEQFYKNQPCSRSYSIANSGGNLQTLVFTIKMQRATENDMTPGIASHYLGNLTVGSKIQALGPFEEFGVLSQSMNTMVLIGAGSGIAPLKAIIEEQIERAASGKQPHRDIYFIYGARTEADLVYGYEFSQLAGINEHFHYLPTLSQASEQWKGTRGYVQEILALNFSNWNSSNNTEFYLCGPRGLMDENIEFLQENGVNANHISYDDFS